MKLSTILTSHAKERLEERTGLTKEAFVQQFDAFQTTSVGYRRASGHWHRLFYSQPDEDFFVAIQDIRNGDVITILPLGYHENLAWPVSEKTKRRALLKVKPDLVCTLPTPPPVVAPSLGTKAEITAISTLGVRKNIGSHRFIDEIESAEDALADETFVSKVLMKSAAKGVQLSDIETLLLYDKRNCRLVTLRWNNLEAIAKNEAQLRAEESIESRLPAQ